MKSHTNRNLPVYSIAKVVPLAACAFFLSARAPFAADNEASGSVYGSNLNQASLSSLSSGSTDLDIYNPVTTTLTLSHEVDGYVNISNSFGSFGIAATGGTLTAQSNTSLSVTGGTNLTVSGGTFGGALDDLSTNDWSAAAGGDLSNVRNAVLDSTAFTGKSIDNSVTSDGPPLPGEYDGANASGSTGLIIRDGTEAYIYDSSVIGGFAGSVNVSETNAWADGGIGLEIYNSSVTLSNTTVTGGAGGSASVDDEYTASADGGNALYASNATVVVQSGTYTGGAAGSEDGETGTGGAGLLAVGGSSITNFGGTFTGASGTAALVIENSALTTYGGTYTGGGLYSATTDGGTNVLTLHGGSFSSLTFVNASNGYQYVSVSNISVATEVYQDGGFVEVENIDDLAFQAITITNESTMAFNQDFELSGSLTLASEGSAALFQGLDVGSGGSLELGLGTISAGDVTLQSGSDISFTVSTNQNGLLDAATVTFETNSSLTVDASLAGFPSGVSTSTIIQTTGGISGFDTNQVNTDIIVSQNTNEIGRTTFAGFDESGGNLALIFDTASLTEFWGVTNGQLADLAMELETLAPTEMNVLINNLGSSASRSKIEQTYFSTLNTFQAAKQGLEAAVGLSLSRGTEFRDQLLLPKGTQGPGLEPQNDWRFWMKYYGQFYSKDRDGLNPEYDATLHGGVIGMDQSFGNLLIGISGGAGNYRLESDAEQRMNAFQGAVYSTYGSGHSYLDFGLAYGFNRVESTTADPFVLEGEFDTHLLSAHLGGGLGFELPKLGTVLTPEAALRYTYYQQEAYTESGTAAVPRSFDEFDSDSMVGMIGLNAAMLNTTALSTFSFKVEGRAHWMREFNPEPGDLNYQLVGGANDYTIIYPYLDEDTIRLGIGLSFFNTTDRALKNVLLRLDFDEFFGDGFNSHNLSAKVIYAF
ncbi:autotransporter domain-containing protein [Pontiella sp.]|uniref:autotransporter family protein n=1 Tax=Pontiella sp. TaxID=2837462 RepID=UPI0035636F8F